MRASELEGYLDEHGDFKVVDNEGHEADVYLYEYGTGYEEAGQYPVIDYDFGEDSSRFRIDTSPHDQGQNELFYVQDYEPFEVVPNV